MSVKALLTIEFEEKVTLIQQEVFNEKLEDLQWIKIPELKSAWEVSFNDFISRNFALNTAKDDITKAAHKAQIIDYSVAIQFGSNWPVRFTSKKKASKNHTP
jgi:hypothetical protein